MGTMPALELDDGNVVAESAAICQRFEALHPEPSMFGCTPLERAQIEMWDQRMELSVAHPVMHAFQHTNPISQGRLTQVKDWGKLSAQTVRGHMVWLDGEWGVCDYVVGDRYTVTDITLQCALIVAKAIGLCFEGEHANLADWFGRVTLRPSASA